MENVNASGLFVIGTNKSSRVNRKKTFVNTADEAASGTGNDSSAQVSKNKGLDKKKIKIKIKMI